MELSVTVIFNELFWIKKIKRFCTKNISKKIIKHNMLTMGSTFVQKIAEIEEGISRSQILNKSLKNKNQNQKQYSESMNFNSFWY